MNVFIRRLIMSLFILLSSFTLNAQQMAKADAKISLEKLMVTHNYMKNPSENLYDLVWENNSSNPYKELAKPNEYIISCKDFSMPLKHTNKITSEFGYRNTFHRNHNGIDLKGYIGDTIYATFAGKVRVVKYEGAGYGYTTGEQEAMEYGGTDYMENIAELGRENQARIKAGLIQQAEPGAPPDPEEEEKEEE